MSSRVGPEYLIDFVKRVSLFPGWTIAAVRGSLTDDVRLTIVTQVPNAQSATHETIPVTCQKFYPPVMQVDPHFWHEEVRRACVELLMHETDEWYRIDGKFYRPPHPENEQEAWKP